jgi:hypothetical protein
MGQTVLCHLEQKGEDSDGQGRRPAAIATGYIDALDVHRLEPGDGGRFAFMR